MPRRRRVPKTTDAIRLTPPLFRLPRGTIPGTGIKFVANATHVRLTFPDGHSQNLTIIVRQIGSGLVRRYFDVDGQYRSHLYFMPGSNRVGTREELTLRYPSDCLSHRQRHELRANRYIAKLSNNGQLGDAWQYIRPHGIRTRDYEAWCAVIERYAKPMRATR